MEWPEKTDNAKSVEKGEVDDVEHWLLRCETWKIHREPLIVMVQEHYEVALQNLDEGEGEIPINSCTNLFAVLAHKCNRRFQDDLQLAAVILSLACRNYKVLSFISYMWHARFN